MSAIVSLLRVMTLRDAEAIVLEAGKVPQLRRRGQVEAMSMGAIDAEMLEAFVRPLVGEREIDGPVMVAFVDEDMSYPVTVEKTGGGGLKVVARKAARKAAAPQPKPQPKPNAVAVTAPVAVAATATATAADAAAVADTATDLRSRVAHLLHPLVAIAKDRDGSDVFVSTGQAPRVRIDGRLEALEMTIDDGELAACGIAGAHDFSLDLDGVRVRVNAFDHMSGVAIAARLIRDRVPSLADLGLPPELAQVVDQRDGLVLVCGPTGSGKSTTLAALVDLLDQRRAAHVITIEDPIEYRFHARRSLIHQRELGTHAPTFAAAVRAALREAPDVILIGELRDRETLAAALTAAETGHLVLATMHAPGAVGAIDRVIDAFPEGQQRQVRGQLAACLRTVVTQYLLPRRDSGRAVAVELVPVTAAVANIIRKGELHTQPTSIQSGRDAGMIPLERSLARLIDNGAVAPAAVKRIAADHDLLSALAPKLR